MKKCLALDLPKQAIAQAKAKFIQAASRTGLDWQAESMFALQACAHNRTLAEVAEGNPWSLTMAMINVASIGITLNPARQLAYLIPRNGKVILDLSYRGLIQIGVDEGAILWAKAEVVREKDNFIYKGVDKAPTHEFNPFDRDRGEVVGTYCLGQLPTGTGSILVEAMPIDEVWKIRDLSMAWVKKAGPWVDFPEEMIKKTVIKRASKTWPGASRLAMAIDYLNHEAGEGLADDVSPRTSVELPEVLIRDDQVPEKMRKYMERLVARARETGLWNNATATILERFQGPYRTWALEKLREAAKQACG